MKKTLRVARCGSLLSALLLGLGGGMVGIAAAAPAGVASAGEVKAASASKASAKAPLSKKASAKRAPAKTEPAKAGPAPAEPTSAVQTPTVFARVGDVVISFNEYNAAYASAARSKFYHGRAPENDVAKLQRDIADALISRILLVQEAKRRGLVVDQELVSKTIEDYEKRNAKNEQWEQLRDRIVPKLTARVEEDNLLEQLEKAVRDLPEPQPEEVLAYYSANPAKFTEPERVRLAAILRKVDPTAPNEAWKKADEELKDVLKQIKEAGADFAAMAREHSQNEKTAENGGDLGYLHQGAVPEVAVALLATMQNGDVSEPVQVLEGMALLKLVDRIPAKLHDFERVQVRAKQLLQRDRSDAAWSGLIAELKKATPPQVDESFFLPLVVQVKGSDGPK